MSTTATTTTYPMYFHLMETITCHWIDNNFDIQKHILPFLYDEDRRHTEKFISESITKIAEYYGIEIFFMYCF